MYGYIYIFVNKINGKMYVGQHKYDKPEKDPGYLTGGPIILKAIEKYGLENFHWDLIDFADTLEELDRKEKEWIAEYDLCHSNQGYNCREGGRGGEISEESKQKMKDNHADFTGENHPKYIHLPMDEVIKMNEDGKSVYEIADYFGVKFYIIKDRLKSLGIKWHNKEIIHVYDTIPMDKVLKLHNKDLTPYKMGQILNIDCRYIRKRLKDIGITPNKPNRFGKDAPGYGHHHPMPKGKDSCRYKNVCPLVCWTQYHLLDRKVEELAKLFNNTMFARLKELGLNKNQKEVRTGRKWINNGIETKWIFPQEIELYRSNGWKLGRGKPKNKIDRI